MRGIDACLLFLLLSSGSILFTSFSYPIAYKIEDPRTTDTVPLRDRYGDFINEDYYTPIDLQDPPVIEHEVEYDPETGGYFISERIGEDFYRAPTYMTFDEYMEWRAEQQERQYFARLGGIDTEDGDLIGLRDPIEGVDVRDDLLERLFGGKEITIDRQGYVELTFGGRFQKTENPVLSLRQQRRFDFDFDMDINMSVQGKIGEKLNLNFNYNTGSNFDFDRQIKIAFDSEQFSEDDIIKKIEAGNVSLPLRSSLIRGSQSLFGIKTELQFGYLRLTAIASQQRSEQENVLIEDGAQVQEFLLKADDYDENRHFFLSDFNRRTFESNMKNLPNINSLFKINKVEVWVTDLRNRSENLREVVAVTDLGASEDLQLPNPQQWEPVTPPPTTKKGIPLPDNQSNQLFDVLTSDPQIKNNIDVVDAITKSPYNMMQGRDFEKRRARLLSPTEYTLNRELGFISLNRPLRPEEVLAVAFEYTYNGEVFQVGQFTRDEPVIDSTTIITLVVKLLKSASPSVDYKQWDLMMKNFYNVGAFQATRDEFKLDIFYDDPGAGLKRAIPEPSIEQPLLRMLNLDNLNELNDPQPDGEFDYVPGFTIHPQTGVVMIPLLEPFGSSLADMLPDNIEDKYLYPELYNLTKFDAQEFQEKNRYQIRGEYKSSVSSEISLGAFNIPRGSVQVTHAGKVLVEGVHYEVNYNLGKVRIIDQSILASNVPVNVSYEDNAFLSLQQKTMIGLRADYQLSDEMSIGATYMHLWERPFTEKVNLGDDPINNRIFGLDFALTTQSGWLTRTVDNLPFIDTKADSEISLYVEGAALAPGHSKAINLSEDEGGTIFLDDFEGATIPIDLRVPTNAWTLSSVPQSGFGGAPVFPGSQFQDTFLVNVNRSLINWYRLEPQVARSNAGPYFDLIQRTEIFPNQTVLPGTVFRTFDISYYPTERGPYNLERPGGTSISAGLDGNGNLLNPESRWGGLMRPLIINDFETSNVEYVEFWMLNPFISTSERNADDGVLYLHLGSLSEDIMKDGASFFEHGLPRPGETIPLIKTNLGIVPVRRPDINAFSTDEEARAAQDVGYDGLGDEEEQVFYDEFLQAISNSNLPAAVKSEIFADPANDNYLFFSNYPDGTSIPDRFKKYNNPENNSPISTQNTGRSEAYTLYPDTEDINQDGSSDQTESYYVYKIPLIKTGAGELAENNFITESIEEVPGERWYRFKIPIDQFSATIGQPRDFRSIRFLRMVLTEFSNPVTLRFAEMNIVRNQWRKVSRHELLTEAIPVPAPPGDETLFDINSVSFERHSEREPWPYRLPPGIERERNFQTSQNNQFFDEKSLELDICNLRDGDARGVFKIFNQDIRLFEKLKMFIHAEEVNGEIEPGDLRVFMRIGQDFSNNYYEVEMPLYMSDDIDQTLQLAEIIWPEQNRFDITLQNLVDAKVNRNSSGFPLTDIYSVPSPDDPETTIKVRGNPSLGDVTTVLLGVLNVADGGGPICTEIWFNELRLTGIDEKGGVAGLARVDANLADFGNVAMSSEYSSIGWGAIDKQLAERQREEVIKYDVSTTFQLGKMFPADAGINLPVFAQYSVETRIPQYDPYDLDVELKDKLDAAEDNEVRDSIREQAIDFSSIKSVGVTGARINPKKEGDEKPKPWDISNISVSYNYNKILEHDPVVEEHTTRHHEGNITYQYNRPAEYIEPAKDLVKSDWFALIRDFNFNPLPTTFGFSTGIDRKVSTRTYRFSDPRFATWVDRRFLWDRKYDLRWNLTRSLSFNFTAINIAVVDELDQFNYDYINDRQLTAEDREEYLWENIEDLGRTKTYNHSISLSYNVPIDKIPALDFVTVRAQLDADYSWTAASVNVDSFGNLLQNSQRRTINGDMNFDKLYNKVPLLQKVNGSRGRASRRGPSRTRTPSRGQETPGNKNRQEEEKEISGVTKALLRPLLMVKKLRGSYTEEYGSTVPGYMPKTSILGMDNEFNGPGVAYITGFQPDDEWYLEHARQDGWFTTHNCFNLETERSYRTRWNAEATLEPVRDLRITLTMEKNFTQTDIDLFKNYGELVPQGQYEEAEYDFMRTGGFGTFTVTYNALNTLFKDDEEDLRETFQQFENYREVISQQLNPGGEPHPEDGSNYHLGFGRIQQDVLIPAFLAAYRDEEPGEVTKDIFSTIPKPNWKVDYNGLSRIKAFQKIFTSFTISHGYDTRLTVNSYNAELDYNSPQQNPQNLDDNFNYYSRFSIPQVVINEAFVPLIGINFKTTNNIGLNLEWRKSRTLAMSFTDYELVETRSEQISAGFAYTIKDVVIGLFQPNRKKGGRTNRRTGATQNTGSDLDFQMDLSIRDDLTQEYLLDLDQDPVPTRGQKVIRFSPSVEYDINERLSVRLYTDYSRSIPYTSLNYPITSIASGFKIRFNL